MPQMIEHAQEQDDVERADALGREVHDVDLEVLDLRSERSTRQLEARLAVGRPPADAAPRVVVGGNHACCAAALGLEGEEAVPGSDVEHGSSRERCREVEPLESKI